MFREMSVVYSGNHCETHEYTMGKIQPLIIKAGGTHSYHLANIRTGHLSNVRLQRCGCNKHLDVYNKSKRFSS
jgi:hypothetical protein